MSTSDTAGFAKFVPGFDFLQNLAKGAGGISHMPNLANWVAPTLNVEELDKRIEELKNVHFWLEQNSRALAATIQALEVQKMTLATLKGMNFNLADVANALKPRMPEATTAAARPQAAPEPAAAPAAEAPAAAASADKAATPEAGADGAKAALSGMVDPIKLWGSLTQQFQQIAATAVKEAASQAVEMEKARSAAAAKVASAVQAAAPAAASKAAAQRAATKATAAPAKKVAAKRAPSSKTAARKTAGR